MSLRSWKAKLPIRYSIWRAKRRGMLYEQRRQEKERQAILARQREAMKLADEILAERRRADVARVNAILLEVFNSPYSEDPRQIAQRSAGCEVYRDEGEAA